MGAILTVGGFSGRLSSRTRGGSRRTVGVAFRSMDNGWGWVPVGISAIGAAVAIWQAWDARRARVNASKSEAVALRAAETAASAQRETAVSLGEMARIAKEQHEARQAEAARKPVPWRLEPGRSMKRGDAYLLVLGGDEPVFDVELTWVRRPSILHVSPKPVPSTMQPGDGVEIRMWRAAGDERPTVLEVHWRREGDSQRTVTRATLS